MQNNSKYPIFKGVFFSYVYIGVYLITGLLTTPLLLSHFGVEYFALLMLVYALITYINNIRLGIPEGLAVLLAKSSNNISNISIIKKSFLLISFFVLIFSIIFFVLDFFISDWRYFLGDVYNLDKNLVLNIFYILIIFALIKIPFDLSLSIFIGFHEVFLEKIYKILTLLFNFILVLYTVYSNISILYFVIFAGIFDLLVSFIAFFHTIYRYKLYDKSITFKQISSKKLLKNSTLFFQFTLSDTLIWGSCIFLVSHLLTLNYVTIYSLTMKIYIYIFYTFVIINSVLAPLYGKYYEIQDFKNIQRVFSFMILLLPLIGVFIWIFTLFFMQDIIRLWSGSDDFFIGIYYIFFMGLFFYCLGFVNSYISLLYSISHIKSVVIIRYSELFVNLLISFICIYFFGLIGVSLGLFFAIFLISFRHFPSKIYDKTNYDIKIDFSFHKKHFIYVVLPSILISFFVVYLINIFDIGLLWKFLLFFTIMIFYISMTYRFLGITRVKLLKKFIKKRFLIAKK